jgi:hypothetical protein
MKRIIHLIIIVFLFLSVFSILYMGMSRTNMVVVVSNLTTMPIDTTSKERKVFGTTSLNNNQTDFASFRKKHLDVYIGKNISPFNQGTIEYETRIDKGYGGTISSHISLFTPDGTSHISLGLYHNDSLFGPNNYLLLQNGSSSKSQFEQRPLNQTIEYGKWYKVKLNINSTAISFYLNGRSITTWLRPADETYTNIHLAGESAAVSFKNMVIERKNNQFSNLFDDRNNNLLEWKIINSILGKSTFIKSEINVNDKYNEDHAIVKVDPETIIVTHSRENSHIFTKYGASAQLLKEIYSPDGTIALSVFRIIRHENIS